eukprot:47901-Eustigmatos_ZCMA.PRE.1
MTLGFQLSCGLVSGDVVRLELPSFGGSSVASLALGGTHSSVFSGSWATASELLDLSYLGQKLPAMTKVQLIIKVSNGITFPVAGLSAND